MKNENLLHGPDMLKPIPEVSLGKRIYDSLLGAAPQEVAYVDAVTDKKLTHLQLLNISCQLARALHNCGYKLNDVISLSAENNIYFYVPAISALYLGLVPAPLNHNYTQRELLHSAGITKPKIIFCSKKVLGTFIDLKKSVDYIERIIIMDPEEKVEGYDTILSFIQKYCEQNFSVENFRPVEVNTFEHLSVILYSSGTTGLPKGVMTTHDNINMRINHVQDPRFHNASSEIIFGILPFFHGFGFMTNIGGLSKRNTIVVAQRFEEDLFLKSIEKYKINNISIVPPIMNFLARSPKLAKYDLTSLQEITCGAAPLGSELERAARNRMPYVKTIRQGYGLTEATLAVIIMPIGESRIGSSGKVISGMTAKVYDPESGKNLGPNEVGELCFKGRMVCKGYYGDLKATKSCYTDDGWVHTGDLGYYDKEGYFYIVDRLKELIKFKGFQVPPAELEAILLAHPKIKDAGVVGKPDEDAGELPTAFVVKEDGVDLIEEEVKKYVAGQVSKPKQLHGGVIFINEIPKNPSGKILRRYLRELLAKQKSKL